MGFWSDYGQGVPEAKRGYRWLCQINSFPQFICKSVTKPGFSISETSHKFINHTFFYPGRVEWSAVDVTLVDPGDPDMVMTLLKMVQKSGYALPSSAEKAKESTISKNKAIQALSNFEIMQVDSEGKSIETWTLKGAWIKSFKFGDLSYDSEELINISLGIRYDWAECKTTGSPHSNVSGKKFS